MLTETTHHTTHAVTVAAPPDVVYGLLADATRWPQYLPPNIHVERLAGGDPDTAGTERLRMWATANGQVKSWTSRRDLDPRRRRIGFRQEVSAPPVASMGGTWAVDPADGGSRLTLLHDFSVVDDRPEDVAWVLEATDRNSTAELANIKSLAEQRSALDELMFSFEDSVHVEGSATAVYDFLYQVPDWPRRLPHVSRLDLVEETPGVQLIEMETVAPDGSRHTTSSVRVCFPDAGRIVYKQTTPPALLTVHTGEWTVVREAADAVTVTSRHTVVLRESAVAQVLGEGATVASARAYLREALGRNSTVTLNAAKAFANTAVRLA